MRIYRTPILIDDEPKIFGGKASLRQALYVLAGLIAAYLAYSVVKPLGKETGIALAAFCILGAAAMAFVKVPKYDMPLDQYLYRIARYKTSQHEFPYKREV